MNCRGHPELPPELGIERSIEDEQPKQGLEKCRVPVKEEAIRKTNG